MTTTDISSAALRRAVELKEQIERLQNELDRILSQQRPRSMAMTRHHAGISDAGRARIVAAQKKRWALHRAQAKAATRSSSASTSTKSPRGGIPAELRAKLAAQAKARWAKVRSMAPS
jgi:hypothetical protein